MSAPSVSETQHLLDARAAARQSRASGGHAHGKGKTNEVEFPYRIVNINVLDRIVKTDERARGCMDHAYAEDLQQWEKYYGNKKRGTKEPKPEQCTGLFDGPKPRMSVSWLQNDGRITANEYELDDELMTQAGSAVVAAMVRQYIRDIILMLPPSISKTVMHGVENDLILQSAMPASTAATSALATATPTTAAAASSSAAAAAAATTTTSVEPQAVSASTSTGSQQRPATAAVAASSSANVTPPESKPLPRKPASKNKRRRANSSSSDDESNASDNDHAASDSEATSSDDEHKKPARKRRQTTASSNSPTSRQRQRVSESADGQDRALLKSLTERADRAHDGDLGAAVASYNQELETWISAREQKQEDGAYRDKALSWSRQARILRKKIAAEKVQCICQETPQPRPRLCHYCRLQALLDTATQKKLHFAELEAASTPRATAVSAMSHSSRHTTPSTTAPMNMRVLAQSATAGFGGPWQMFSHTATNSGGVAATPAAAAWSAPTQAPQQQMLSGDSYFDLDVDPNAPVVPSLSLSDDDSVDGELDFSEPIALASKFGPLSSPVYSNDLPLISDTSRRPSLPPPVLTSALQPFAVCAAPTAIAATVAAVPPATATPALVTPTPTVSTPATPAPANPAPIAVAAAGPVASSMSGDEELEAMAYAFV